MTTNPYHPLDAESGKQVSTRRQRRSLWWGAVVGAGLWALVAVFKFLLDTGSLRWEMPLWRLIVVGWLFIVPVFVSNCVIGGVILNDWLQFAAFIAIGAYFYGPAGVLIQLAVRHLPRRRGG